MSENRHAETVTRRVARSLRSLLQRAEQHPVAVAILCLGASGVAVLGLMSSVSNDLIQETALRNAVAYNDALTAFRTLYTSEVVGPAKKAGIEVCHDYDRRKGAIPLPATLSMRLGDQLGDQASGSTTRLYSDYPFPWRTSGGPSTEFERKALAALRRNPSRPFYEFQRVEGQEVLSYATADLMRTSCVSCHNSHPDSPKTDWEVGDVRGVLEVTVPLDESTGMVQAGIRQAFLLMLVLCSLGGIALAVFLKRRRQVAESMERRNRQLRRQTDDLEAAAATLKEMHDAAQERAQKLERLRRASMNMMRDAERSRLETEAAHTELQELRQEHLEVARHAGMAEIATGVLHNVGNVLNSVNVSANLLTDRVKRSRVEGLQKALELMEQHREDLGHFLTVDAKGQRLPQYLARLAEELSGEKEFCCVELSKLLENVEHIKEIVQVQQSYARRGTAFEDVELIQLVESAIHVNISTLDGHSVEVVRDFQAQPVVKTDKHKVLQILVNLITNAKNAMVENECPVRRITISVRVQENGQPEVQIRDTGIGISHENLEQIFCHGFTTRKKGHGFGLHSSANAATELGGSLTAFSEGVGHGAVFTLHLAASEARPAEVAG